jgi:hypothetical protein
MRLYEFAEQPDDLGFDVVDDVQEYMKNDSSFYRRVYYPTMCKMQECMEEQKDPKDLVRPMIELATRLYVEKYNINKKPQDLLTSEDYDDLINRVYEDEVEALRNGEY